MSLVHEALQKAEREKRRKASLAPAPSTSDCERSQIATLAPSCAKAWTISQPMPRADPVTRATLSSSFIVKPAWMLYIATASIIPRADQMQTQMRDSLGDGGQAVDIPTRFLPRRVNGEKNR